jgi:hypothetical protein
MGPSPCGLFLTPLGPPLHCEAYYPLAPNATSPARRQGTRKPGGTGGGILVTAEQTKNSYPLRRSPKHRKVGARENEGSQRP